MENGMGKEKGVTEDIIVCKFGGSSVADAKQIRAIRDIVAADPRRKVIVVSAPGRDLRYHEKITDHLFNIATGGGHFFDQRKKISVAQSKKAIIGKFEEILRDLELNERTLIDELKKDLSTELEGDRRTAFYASRGEHFNARIIAAYFNASGLPSLVGLPEDLGFQVSSDYLDAKVLGTTYENIAAELNDREEITVIPGYYGITVEGEVAVLSRGGSDLTGGEIAYALDAAMYENWTDTDGVYEVDPALIPNARVIPRLTFKEIRLLSAKGFNVFHLDAMLKCKRGKIPINIRNTNKPEIAGTLVLTERVPEEGIVGIAKLDNMAYIHLEKDTLGEEIGFTAALLTIFHKYYINTYHYPTDKDDIAVLVNQEDLKGVINELRREIEKKLEPDAMKVVYNLSIITPVGLGLKGNSYAIVDAITALGAHNIPIEMIDQSPSQICFHIGVQNAVADQALRILHDQLTG